MPERIKLEEWWKHRMECAVKTKKENCGIRETGCGEMKKREF